MSNYLSLGASSVLGSILALWATSHLARALGVEVFGTFNVARAVVEYALIPASFGVTVVASRAIASGVTEPRRFAAMVVVLRMMLSLVGLLVVGLSLFVVRDQSARSLLAIMALAVPLVASQTDWLFSAHEDQRWPGVVRVVGRGLYTVLVVTNVRGPADASVAAAALVFESAATSLLFAWKSREWLSFARPLFRWRAMSTHFLESARLGTATLAQRLKTNADLLMLSYFAVAAQVGYYSASYRLVLFVNSLAALYATVLMPRIARARSDDQHESYIFASARLTFAVAVAVSVGGAVVGGPALVLLMGAAYEPAVPVVSVLLVASGFIVTGSALGYTAIALGYERFYSRMIGGAAALNIVANLVAIPVFGMHGAAVTTVATEAAIVVALVARLWKDGMRRVLGFGWVLRLAASAAGVWASASVSLWFGLGVPVAVAAGALAWAILVAVLRVLSREQLRLLV